MFLIDKYTPKSINESFFNKSLLQLLQTMSNDESIPHIIFYGNEGSGKKTIINLFLQMLFDKNVLNTKDVPYKIYGSSDKHKIENIKQSDYHISIEPKKHNSDRFIIHDVVKEYAKRGTLGIFQRNRTFKIVLINNLDNLSYYAQTSLRRTMESYSHECRFIMWCNSISKIINPLLSRCVCLAVPTPSNEELLKYLFHVSFSEKICIPLSQYDDIIKYAKGNIKKALWYLDFLKYGCEIQTDYINAIDLIVEYILDGKLENIMCIRQIVFQLTITNYNPQTILQDILLTLLSQCNYDDNIKNQFISLASTTDYKLVKGCREITQFDYFVISAIFIIHNI